MGKSNRNFDNFIIKTCEKRVDQLIELIIDLMKHENTHPQLIGNLLHKCDIAFNMYDRYVEAKQFERRHHKQKKIVELLEKINITK
jgi:hypothetical protein